MRDRDIIITTCDYY